MPFQFRKEAIEEDLNTNFPSQGQGNPPLYYSLSEVVVPTYSINSVAEGSGLPQNLQTAWDFSTGFQSCSGAATTTLINNSGFWKVDLTASLYQAGATIRRVILQINDGISTKTIWQAELRNSSASFYEWATDDSFVVFLRSGDSLECVTNQTDAIANVWYRQIADVNGTLVNPLGFSFA